ncbi:phosphoglycerate kinase [Patescibacteria group bacterium]|nr:phosphoglycerate kinase [Patescibacteria group bacterium]
MENYSLLSEAELAGKRVLLRAGFDVPYEVKKEGADLPQDDGEKWVEVSGVVSPEDDTQVTLNARVSDTSRIEAIVPTMQEVLKKKAALIIMSHQSRPKGARVASMSQKPLVSVLERLLGKKVQFAEDCAGPQAKQMAEDLKPGEVLLLENLRYDSREKKNDPKFAKELAGLADVYVNDAFPNCHRPHASVVGVTEHLPSYMGLQLQKEVENLSEVRDNPIEPLTLIVCGAKMETKVPVIESFLDKGNDVLLGGCIGNTFLAADGVNVGKSKYEEDQIPKANEIIEKSGKGNNAEVHMPSHVVVASELSDDAQVDDVTVDKVEENKSIFDIGEDTAHFYSQIISTSKMIVWNGPVGVSEIGQFANGTKSIARAIAEATKKGAKSYIGGGDTIDFHTRYPEYSLDAYTFASTGGGAMLEFISGGELPALKALSESARGKG